MATNPFKFTGLTYDDIMVQINSMINSDSRFANFRESDVGQFIVEMFAGTTDIINYYLQRRAEECYFDTAQHKSSIISLSRMFGYDVKRPIPAKAYVQMSIAGDLSGLVSEGDVIQIPYFVSFAYGDSSFILQDTFTHKITHAEMHSITALGSDYVMTFPIDSITGASLDDYGRPMTLLQGDIRETVIQGASNIQLSSQYQKYKIDDVEFSNLYGVDDWVYDKVTRVYVGQNKTEDTRFDIDRKSLINWETIANSRTVEGGAKVCLVRSAPDETVEVLFGNGGENGFASLGAQSVEDNIYIQYLGTKGSSANQTGVIGKKLSYSGKVYTTKGVDLSSKATFMLGSNISGGADMESLESIKYAAPKIYYSLDRLVSKNDYIAYLKSLTYPITIKNAIAWGEQEQKGRGEFADYKSFNAAYFSCLGSLYNLEGDEYSVKSGADLYSAVLDDKYSERKINNQSIYNVYTRQLIAKQVKSYQTNADIYNRVYNLTNSTYQSSASYLEAFKNVSVAGTYLYFYYTADEYDYASNLSTSARVKPDFSTLSKVSEVGEKLTAVFADIIDYRGDDLGIQNSNYGYAAFPGMTITSDWDELTHTASIRIVFPMGDPDNPNYSYIKRFFKTNALTGLLGISSSSGTLYSSVEKIQKVVEEPISDKIVSVIDNLSNRSQITVQNIYISPLIHSYYLNGTVYIKPFYDIESVKNEINNAIYSWLDVNADFNNVIYKSNIVQIIEDNSAVINVDLDILPDSKKTSYTVAGDSYYDGDWEIAGTNVSAIQSILSEYFDPMLSSSNTYVVNDDGSKTYATEDWFFNKQLSAATNAINDYLITEGSAGDFAFVYATSITVDGSEYTIDGAESFKAFVNATGMIPDYSGYFIHAINSIRSALLYKIKKYSINSNGNISKYTVGSEIAKIDCSRLKYKYR